MVIGILSHLLFVSTLEKKKQLPIFHGDKADEKYKTPSDNGDSGLCPLLNNLTKTVHFLSLHHCLT
jgi:hypothetical protein